MNRGVMLTTALAASAALAAPATAAAAAAKHRPPPPPPPPANTAPPVVTGATFVGDQLATTTGSWSNSPTSFSYQWWQCASTCSTIPGATQSTFTLTSAQARDTIESEVTASNAGGSASAFSTPSPAVVVPTPAVAYQLNQAHTGVSPDPLASK